MKIICRLAIGAAALWGILLLTGCANAPQTESTAGARATLTVTEPTLSPSQTPLPPSAESATPNIKLTLSSYALTNPPPTPTATPIIQADDSVTWHPQKKLVFWQEAPGNTTNLITHFVLYWDGTLKSKYIEGSNSTETIFKVKQDEICKILNTVNASGFFGESNPYHSSALIGEYIDIHGWKAYENGAVALDSLLSGLGSTIPSEENIIKPGLANTYYFLKNYQPVKPAVLPIESILVNINQSNKESTTTWPLTSVTLDEFIEMLRCRKNCYDVYEPTLFSGELAQEIITKVGNGATFTNDELGTIQITYEADAPDVPADATMTCNTKGPTYPILSLNPANKFWNYTLSGKWAAEWVEGQNKMRVVNIAGYEKFYSYDAAFFGQNAIQAYPSEWSLDDQFLYVNVLPANFNPKVSLTNSVGLQQIDIKNEKIKYLFVGTHGEQFDYQFTDFGRQLVYIRAGDNPLKLVVANTSSGEQKAVSLKRPDGIAYTSAGTLLLRFRTDSIFLAASYTENGEEKTDILWTHLSNLSNLKIIYTAQGLMKIDRVAFICPLSGVADYRDCKVRVNVDTGEIIKE